MEQNVKQVTVAKVFFFIFYFLMLQGFGSFVYCCLTFHTYNGAVMLKIDRPHLFNCFFANCHPLDYDSKAHLTKTFPKDVPCFPISAKKHETRKVMKYFQ